MMYLLIANGIRAVLPDRDDRLDMRSRHCRRAGAQATPRPFAFVTGS
ncbi:hypothetical protein [Burkholderia sp. NFPP32]|nr:hypothetical protein [Burkholderia sp. NFPP32]